MSFSDFYVNHRTRKSNFLNQIDHLIDWKAIEADIRQHYAPASDITGRSAYPGLLLFKMLLVGIWNGGLSDEAVEDAWHLLQAMVYNLKRLPVLYVKTQLQQAISAF